MFRPSVFATLLLVTALYGAVVRAQGGTLVISNDDGWATAQIRAQYEYLVNAAYDVGITGFTTCLAIASVFALRRGFKHCTIYHADSVYRTIDRKATRIFCLCAISILYASTACYWISSVVLVQVVVDDVTDYLFQQTTLLLDPSTSSSADTNPTSALMTAYYPLVSKMQSKYVFVAMPCMQTAFLVVNVGLSLYQLGVK